MLQDTQTQIKNNMQDLVNNAHLSATPCLFRPSNVNAQHACDEAKQRMYRIAATETRHVPDSLQTLLDLAAFVRELHK